MPTLTGNLTELTITDADLLARLPQVVIRYLPPGATDFAPQRAAGQADALADFQAFTGYDPAWAKATQDSAWQRILTFTTLLILLRTSTDEKSRELAQGYAAELSRSMQNFQYALDLNQDGTIDPAEAAAKRNVQEVDIFR